MADKTGIEWTDSTWNPISGCSIVSPGCTNCYAMRQAARIVAMAEGAGKTTHYAGTVRQVKDVPVWTGEVHVAADSIFLQPIRWRQPKRIFVNSMSDLFHDAVPDAVIDRVFAIMALTPQHTYQVLSKRPARMRNYCSSPKTVERISALVYDAKYEQGTDHPLARGVWRTRNRRRGPDLEAQKAAWEASAEGRERISEGDRHGRLSASEGGVSEPGRLPLDYDDDRECENGDRRTPGRLDEQQRADPNRPDDPILLNTPAALHWVSAEPLLGALDLTSWLRRLHWVVAGGESGPGARPMHPDWARSLRDQCQAAGVPFLFKQWGSWQITYDRDVDDPDWRRCPTAGDHGGRYINLEGGTGFHGARVCYAVPSSKHAAGRLLDGVLWDQYPEVRT